VTRSLAVPLLTATMLAHGSPPGAVAIAPGARAELHRLWASSMESRTERVGCLASTIEGDTVRITRVQLLDGLGVDSLAVGAEASLEMCAPPLWQGTVHTHIALRDGRQPYSRFSGADRGVMQTWGQRWKSQGTFCLLYAETSVHCELDGPSGILILPSTTY
jgi:hypothetical protein